MNTSELQPTPDDTTEAEEVSQAIEAFKDRHNRRYPTHGAILKVFRTLGYKNETEANPRP